MVSRIGEWNDHILCCARGWKNRMATESSLLREGDDLGDHMHGLGEERGGHTAGMG